MEVKFTKRGINNCELEIYVDNSLWKRVKSSYFERKMTKFIKSGSFKKEFNAFEKKKLLQVALILLTKRGYLKKEWVDKMRAKLFPYTLIEEVYEESLSPYFNEKEEVKRRIRYYLEAGKGRSWIKQKVWPHVSLSQAEFTEYLNTYLPEEAVIEKISYIASSRDMLEKKGREKTIAFFLRRGYSYNQIIKSLHALDSEGTQRYL